MIVGTAGHVDHGKTSLVKSLTGIDTDRLPEEKRRGITLELGFAHLTLPGGQTVSVVDVPGHERFLKAMTAGAGGMDLLMLVVAADEGVRPQTREHLDVCRLLGVKRGLFVLSKSDLPHDAAERERELRAVAKGTFLENAPVLPVSAKSGAGLDALKAALAQLAREIPARREDGPLFLPIDRAFTVAGFGTVVTGTLWSGTVTPEQQVALLPDVEPRRVRGVQVHGKPVERAVPGERTALNLAGVEAHQLERGQVVTRAGELSASSVLDVEVDTLQPLPRRTRFSVSLGTAHVDAQLRLLDVDALAPGDRGYGQLRLDRPIAALPDQRFILRRTRPRGEQATVAGGRVLSLDPPRRRKGSAARLAAFAHGTPAERAALLLEDAGHRGTPRTALALPGVGTVVAQRAYSDVLLKKLEQKALQLKDRPREQLQKLLGLENPDLFAWVVARLPAAAAPVADSKLAALLDAAGLTPPLPAELEKQLKLDSRRLQDELKKLSAAQRAVRVGELWFSTKAIAALAAQLTGWMEQNGGLSTQKAKELTGLSRKFLIPLLEHLDATKVTLRVGEQRVLRKKN